jgi:O-antigen ligase
LSIEPFERLGQGLHRLRQDLRQAWTPANQPTSAAFAGALGLLFASTLFGGASQTNALSLMGVELASLPLLFVSLYLIMARAVPSGTMIPLGLLAAIVAVPILQLVPLPASVWSAAPGRAPLIQALAAVHQGLRPLPFSLAPQQTWRCALALAPPAAMFMGGLVLSDGHRRVMVGCWLMLAVLSVVIGALQVLGSDDSALYFYRVTNAGSAVGLFANRNHQATFLFCLIPLAGVFAIRFRGRIDSPRNFPAFGAIVYIFVAVIGVAATRSRVGILLTGVALAAAAVLATRGGVLRRHWRATLGIAAASLATIGGVLIVGLGPILDRFSDGAAEPRFEGWPIVLGAAQSFLPFGSGVGSFEVIYESVEPLRLVSPIYFNHAHNDYLELWLETGVVGAALLALVLGWLGVRIVAIWRATPSVRADLAAACTLLVVLVLAHSAVDYPLRTEAVAVLVAFALSTIAVFRPSERQDPPPRRRQSGR